MEYLSNGNLADFIKSFEDEDKHIPERELVHIFRQLVEGVLYLSSRKFVHRNIKPENILFSQDWIAKISDFGISAFKLTEEERQGKDQGQEEEPYLNYAMKNSVLGPEDYLGPEMINQEEYDQKYDIFCLGQTIFKMMTYELPLYIFT